MKRVISWVLIGGAAITCLWISGPRRLAADQVAVSTVTFNQEIVEMLDNHCVMCHSENNLSFPLETYEQTFVRGQQLRVSVLSRQMPPWSAVSGYEEFVNDNSMNFRETQFLASWVDGAGPRVGPSVFLNVADPHAAAAAQVKAHFDANRWRLGTPDLLISVPENTVAPQTEQVKEAVIDPKLSSDRWLRAIAYKPGDRRLVHAVFFKIQESGDWIGSWTPWYDFFSFPKGLAYRVPAGSHIVAEIHYEGVKESAVDQGSLGLYFSDEPSIRPVADLALTPRCNGVGEQAASQKCVATVKLAADTNVVALWPQLHTGLQSLEVAAKAPNGAIRVLLFARDPSMAWPTPYILKWPAALSTGTELSVTEYGSGADMAVGAGSPVILSGYQGSALPTGEPLLEAKIPASSTKTFHLTGTIRSVDAQNGKVVVQHGDIPGFMGAMTMAYTAGNNEDLSKISSGDEIQADVIVGENGNRLENIKVTGHSK